MASSRFSSNSPDLRDVATAWEGFEKMNGVTVTMGLCSQWVGENWQLVLEGCAWVKPAPSVEARLLVSEKLICSDTSWVSLEVAAFRLLYALDAALAFRELGGKRKRSEAAPGAER